MGEGEASVLAPQSEQNSAAAQTDRGLQYYSGRDYAQARQWYEKAAAQGHAGAQVNLGILYANGQGVPQDYAQARQWYEKAAAQGHAGAQFNLGILNDNGQGGPQDYAQARQWWEKAAAQGHAGAQNGLGALYANGQGGPQDFAQARQWYEKAAAQGHEKAKRNLEILPNNRQDVQVTGTAMVNFGRRFANGQGVPQDDVYAYMWYSLAVPHLTGVEQRWAADGRDFAASRMTPAQLAEAQRLASQCQAQQFKGC